MPGTVTILWRFAEAEFDEARWELRVAGRPVELEPRPLEVLHVLLRQAGELVTREQLLDAVYGHRHVGAGALSNAIGKLRKVLGGAEQSVIATVHGSGYRLVAPVERLPVPEVPTVHLAAGAPAPRRPGWRLERRLDVDGRDAGVWLARDAETDDLRVYKYSDGGRRASALRREYTLYRVLEKRLGARPDLVRVLDHDFAERPYFIACDYGGPNLAEWLIAAGGVAGVPLETRLALFGAIVEAVAAAHSAGVLHQDLKPANVLVGIGADGSPQPRLADFGSGSLLAPETLAALDITRLGFTQTVAGEALSGTPLYLAPELLQGDAPSERSDVYALGVMLYQLVVGALRRPLAPGWEDEVADELLCEDIAAAAQAQPAKRLGSARELAERVRSLPQRRLERRRDLEARKLSAERERSAARNRRRLRAVAWPVAALALAGTAALWAYNHRPLPRGETRNEEAHKAYLQGMYFHGRFSEGDLRRSLTAYERAVQLDPAYGKAWSEMAASWGALADILGGNEAEAAWRKARETSEHALALDPELGLNHASLGWVLMDHDWNLPAAKAELERAVALAPSELRPRNNLAVVLANLGEVEIAVKLLHESAPLGPLSAGLDYNLANYLLYLGRNDEAEAAIREALSLEPSGAGNHALLAAILLARGRVDEALTAAHAEIDPVQLNFALGVAEFAAGHRGASDAALQRLIDGHAIDGPSQIADVYAFRGEVDAAFDWLDRAYAAHDPGVMGILNDSFFKLFAGDERFLRFVQRLGLRAREPSVEAS